MVGKLIALIADTDALPATKQAELSGLLRWAEAGKITPVQRLPGGRVPMVAR